jgi:hypothetical protein
MEFNIGKVTEEGFDLRLMFDIWDRDTLRRPTDLEKIGTVVVEMF